MEEDEQKLRVRLVGRNGRRRYDPASKDRLVSACLESGVSVSRLALEHGVNANLLRKWIKKRTETQSLPPSSPPAFIPVQIESTSDRALLRQSSMPHCPARRVVPIATVFGTVIHSMGTM